MMTHEERIQRVEKAMQDAGFETGAIIETARGIHTVYSVEYFSSIFNHNDYTDHKIVILTPDEDKVLIMDVTETLNLI